MLKLLWKKGCLPMRPTWKGSSSFGLVYSPVAVYPATREEKISFRQLRSSDLSPLRYNKVAQADSTEVPADQIVKGCEFERDRLFLILELMHFASEILSSEVLKNGSATAVSDKELKMAQALIESMAVSWEPEKYLDEYRTALMEMIEQKAQNREIAAKAPAPPAPTNVVDLVKVLQDSLNRTQSLKQKRASGPSSGRRSTRSE